ncbi:TPA: hypothetical protein HA219_03410 [Candidatus Woesearchaeota archaeon]|nr:hypothetical protein [Candidatus Woesearchaeota archaeon]
MKERLSKKFFDLLVEQQRITAKRISALFGRHVSYQGKEGIVVGRINRLLNGDLVLLPSHVFSHGIGKGDIAIRAKDIYHIDETPTYHSVQVGNRVIHRTTHQVYLRPPKKILALQHNENVIEFSVSPSDRHLDRLLREYDVPVKSLSDLRRLTRIIHNEIGFERGEDRQRDFTVPLGRIISKYGAKCRHLAALEYAILKLQNKNANVVHTNNELYPELDEMHSFLHVRIGDEIYAADPTHNIVIPLRELTRYLSRLKKRHAYHHKAKPVRFEFNYDR